MSLEWARQCVRQSKLIPESSFGVRIESPIVGKTFCLTKNFTMNESDKRQNHIEIMREALRVGGASIVLIGNATASMQPTDDRLLHRFIVHRPLTRTTAIKKVLEIRQLCRDDRYICSCSIDTTTTTTI